MRPDVPLTNVARRDIETLLHPYTNLAVHRETGPLTLERAEGVYVYDGAGKPYLEGMAGLWCTSLGYGNEDLVDAAANLYAFLRALDSMDIEAIAAMPVPEQGLGRAINDRLRRAAVPRQGDAGAEAGEMGTRRLGSMP